MGFGVTMRKVRVFVDQKLDQGKELMLGQAYKRYLYHVLRLSRHDLLVLFDGHGGEYDATILNITKHNVIIRVDQYHPINRVSSLKITLLQAISGSQKMDFTLQKATELGVDRIVPVITQYGSAHLYKQLYKKLDHWRKIIISACEQCGQNAIPELAEPLKLDAEFGMIGNGATKIILHPESKCSLSKLSEPQDHIMILVGPEGGFSGAELSKAHDFGYQPINLGPRILRTETAALAAISGCQMLWGDMT